MTTNLKNPLLLAKIAMAGLHSKLVTAGKKCRITREPGNFGYRGNGTAEDSHVPVPSVAAREARRLRSGAGSRLGEGASCSSGPSWKQPSVAFSFVLVSGSI